MRIVVLSDVHYTGKKWRSQHLKVLNEKFYNTLFHKFFDQDADLYVSLGDLTHYGTVGEFKEVQNIIKNNKRNDQRFLSVVGNHDLLCMNKRVYQHLSNQPLYWAEDHPDAKLIFLDTCRQLRPGKASSRFDWAQVQFLRRELRSCGNKLAIVFAHHPTERIIFYGPDGKKLPNMTMESLLNEKEGPGIYVNGHLHQDRYMTKGQWGFLQFNDILDEPTVRVLDVVENKVAMETVALDDPQTLMASRKIAKAVLTFLNKRNDDEYARIRDLELDSNIIGPMHFWNMQPVRITNKPYFAVK